MSIKWKWATAFLFVFVFAFMFGVGWESEPREAMAIDCCACYAQFDCPDECNRGGYVGSGGCTPCANPPAQCAFCRCP
jgi:hypothetical protein